MRFPAKRGIHFAEVLDALRDLDGIQLEWVVERLENVVAAPLISAESSGWGGTSICLPAHCASDRKAIRERLC